MTPCMSPVPHYGPTFGKHGLGLVKENAEHTGMKKLQGKNGTVLKVTLESKGKVKNFSGSFVLVHKRSSFNICKVQPNLGIIMFYFMILRY